MTHKEQNPTPEEMRKAMRMMQVRMRNNALHHFERIGIRTGRALQALGLIDDEMPGVGEEVDLSVLLDTKHVRRQALPDGPLVLYLTEGDPPKRMVVELPVLFFSDSRDVREASLQCVDRIAAENQLSLTPKTVEVLKKWRDDVVSDDASKWRPASVAISDALYDDVLVALGGTSQSLESEPVIQDSLNFYSAKVIHPSVPSLDSISLAAGHPERDHETLTKLLSEIVARATDLSELCSLYLSELGFLPLAPPYCLAAAVSSWFASNPNVDVWQGVWGWADTKPTPLSRYHACSVFVLHPELIPDGKLSELWNEIVAVVHDSDMKDADLPEHEPWALRRDLARHYAYHLEARLPDNDGASIACFAWWFAEHVAALFPPDVGAARFYRENWVMPASNLSSHMWLAASSPIQRSFLRYVTFTMPSPWAVALLALMGEHLDKLSPAEQEEEVQVRFHEAMISNTIASLPFPIDTPNSPTFALECSLSDTVLKWAEHQAEEQQNALRQLVGTSRALGTNDGVSNALRKLGESSLADQVAVCLALKAKAYTEPAIAEAIWEVVSDATWRKEVLASAEMQVQELLIESLSVLLVDNREKWFAFLPHYIADMCEHTEDEERRRVLFLYVVHTSLASDTVSAVRRLLRGEQKAKFVEFAKEYRDRVEAMRSDYPPWVAGKLRGLMASLHVV